MGGAVALAHGVMAEGAEGKNLTQCFPVRVDGAGDEHGKGEKKNQKNIRSSKPADQSLPVYVRSGRLMNRPNSGERGIAEHNHRHEGGKREEKLAEHGERGDVASIHLPNERHARVEL